jgi:hypothetical protein
VSAEYTPLPDDAPVRPYNPHMAEGWRISVVQDGDWSSKKWPWDEGTNRNQKGASDPLGEVKNALLYGSDVVWFPAHLARRAEMLPHIRGEKTLFEMNTWLQSLRAAVEELGLPLRVIAGIQPAMTNRGPDIFAGIDHKVRETVSEADVLIADLNEHEDLAARHWDTYEAAQALMQALSGLVVPDMSTVPLEAISDMRDRLSIELEGVRAEMLRLTEQLRNRVLDNVSQEELCREARNMIRATVEPVVRETDLITRDLMRRRWTKFALGVGRVFMFCTGAVLLRPDLAVRAVEAALDGGASILDLTRQAAPFKYSPRFVFKARGVIAKHTA